MGCWGSSALGCRLIDQIWCDDPFPLPERQDVEPALAIPNGDADEPIAAAVSVHDGSRNRFAVDVTDNGAFLPCGGKQEIFVRNVPTDHQP